MPKIDEKTMEIARRLDRHCKVIQKECEGKGDHLNQARVLEIKNIRFSLVNLIEDPELLEPNDFKETIENLVRRVRDLKFNPESAGHHSSFVNHPIVDRIVSTKKG